MTYGLVLSGGGARGIMHLGVIQALEECNIPITYISGTSAGAIIGSLYSYGYPVDEIFNIITKTNFFKSLRPAWTWTGILSLDNLHNVILSHIPENDFDALKIKLSVAATDLLKGESVYFTKGKLVSAILASSCVPGIFKPIDYNDTLFVDGGVLDNLPVSPIREKCDYVIASHCNPIDKQFDRKNLKAIIERSLLMAVSGNTSANKKLCDLLIEPEPIGKFGGYELARAKEMKEIGYVGAMEKIHASGLSKIQNINSP